MGFEKGNTFCKGRPKGSENKEVKALREKVKELLENNYDKITADLEKLTPKDRVSAWLGLLEFSLPKLQRIEAEVDVESNTEIDFEKLSTEEIKQLIIILQKSRD